MHRPICHHQHQLDLNMNTKAAGAAAGEDRENGPYSTYIEELLCDTQAWALWSVKLIGYNVLSVSGSGRGRTRTTKLVLKPWWSFARLYPYLHVIGLLTFSAHYYYNCMGADSVLQDGTRASGTTEYFIMIFSVNASFIVGLTYKVLANWYAGCTLRFWRRTCALLEYIASAGLRLDQHEELFRRCKASNRLKFLLYYGIICSYTLVMGIIYPILVSVFGWRYMNSTKAPSLMYLINFAYWGFFSTARLCVTIWIGSFLDIYHCCVRMLKLDLEQLLRGQEREPPVENLYENLGHQEIKHPPDLTETRILNGLRIYYKLEAHLQGYNAEFGTRILIEVLLHAVYLLMYTFACISWINPSYNNQLTLVFLIPELLLHMISLYNFGSSSSRLTQECHRLLAVLELLAMEIDDVGLRQKMNALMFKIMMNPLEPTAKQFFTLNRSLITSVAGAITTYLVVLIQFRHTDLNNKAGGGGGQ